MRGVVYLGDSEVEVRDFNRPEPGPGQVVIEMRVAGLCGSDLHKYHSSREWARERNGMISGHEPAGVVADVGKDVENVSEGDRVCVYHTVGCGHCAVCVSGTPVFCSNQGAFGRTRDGSHADYHAHRRTVLHAAAGQHLICSRDATGVYRGDGVFRREQGLETSWRSARGVWTGSGGTDDALDG